MTILEWMKASTRFSFEDINLKSIALGREINDTSVEVTTLSTREKELLRADMILFVFIGSPSSIASESILHNNFQHTRGSEGKPDTISWEWAKKIYERYTDDNFQLMIDIQKEKPISFPDIIDII
mgnify:FL=1